MYIPESFHMTDASAAYQVIRENSFATVFSLHNGLPCATHLPLLLNPDETCLHGHFALGNPQWRDIQNQSVLAVFHGPHCYISPSWYETNRAVPTWNYVAVHVYGTVELLDDPDELLAGLREMVANYEQPSSSYSLNEVDPAFTGALARGIKGFKLHITKIEGKAKLSQNHSAERQQRIIQQLEASGQANEQRISSLIKMNLEKL